MADMGARQLGNSHNIMASYISKENEADNEVAVGVGDPDLTGWRP